MSYLDLQVNGYGGTDFNRDDLSPEDLHRACHKLDDDGVGGILATVITEQVDTMCARLAQMVTLREAEALAKRVIPGLPVEGPFISSVAGYRGAHPLEPILPADIDVMHRLLDARSGLVRVVTLAPESDPGFRVTKMLANRGIVVSAGHTDAAMDQLRVAIDAGLRMF